MRQAVWGSSFSIAIMPLPRFAPKPRLHLSGHHRLPSVLDLNVLVDVLNDHVLLAP
jgi:hypothetical protein